MDGTTSSELTPEIVSSPPRPDWREIAHHAVEHHRAIQHSGELGTLLTLADHAQVRTVLEIGTFAGGSAWAWAQLPSVQRVITVDREPQAEAYPTIAALAPKAIMIQAESVSRATVTSVREALAGQLPDLLYIDSGVDSKTASDEWAIYGYMVRPGGLIAINNVELHYSQPSSGPSLLWASIHTGYPSLKITAAPGEWAGLGLIWR